MKVLMVEDEELTREGLRRSIPWESLGITEVHTAEDGEEGLHKAPGASAGYHYGRCTHAKDGWDYHGF